MNPNDMTPDEMMPVDAMLGMVSGFWTSRAIYVAAKLGLADLLYERPRTAIELAEATGMHASSLRRVLRALASVGVLAEREEGRFDLTPVGATLRTGVPGSLRAFVASELGEGHYQAWGELLHSVKTGEIAFDHVYGMPVWEYYAGHPELAQTFNESMTCLTKVVEPAVLESYDFSNFKNLVDVGGGHASLLSAVLKRHAQVRGVLFDAPGVVEGARRRVTEENLAERCEVRGGDFFTSVPEGGDAYMMKHIIHDWDDERAVSILKNCRRAMKDGGKLLVIDQVIPEGDEFSIGKLTDLIMMVMVGGRERTAAEFKALLAAAGFKLTRIVPTPSHVCIIEGEKA
ncbi:MAG: methyltransferase [Pyrinomonadaceae bacterium]